MEAGSVILVLHALEIIALCVIAYNVYKIKKRIELTMTINANPRLKTIAGMMREWLIDEYRPQPPKSEWVDNWRNDNGDNTEE